MNKCICGQNKDKTWTVCIKHWGDLSWIKKIIKEKRKCISDI